MVKWRANASNCCIRWRGTDVGNDEYTLHD